MTAPVKRKSSKGAKVLWTFLRWTIAFFLVYGYALFLGSTLAKTPPGWVTQNVALPTVYLIGSGESPLGLQAVDLEWIDTNSTLARAPQVVVGNVPVDQQCDVTEVPPALKAPTTTSTVSTLFPSATSTTSTPPVTTPADIPVAGKTRVAEPNKICAPAIQIRYDPSNPSGTVQVVGAKDIEVGLPALVYLILIGTIGFFAFLISLAATGFPPNEPQGSIAVGVGYAVLGIVTLAVGPIIAWDEPVLAMSLVLPAVFFFMKAATHIRRKVRKRDPAMAEPAQPAPYAPPPQAQPDQSSMPPQPQWTPPPAPPPPGSPHPGFGVPPVPPPGPPTPWQNPQPPAPGWGDQGQPAPPDEREGGQTSF